MINHFITCLYGLSEQNPDGVYNPLTSDLTAPDALAPALRALRGGSSASAWSFAKALTKIVDSSTFQSELLVIDNRVTYDIWRLVDDRWNAAELMTRVRNMPAEAIQLVILGQADLERSYRRIDIFQESVAALAVGIVRKITQHNGLD